MIRYRNGAYEVVVNVGPDPVTGKRRQVSRTLRMPERKRIPDVVKDLEAQLRREVGRGEHGQATATVGELLDAWMAKIAPDRSPNTMRGYENCIRLYLKPNLGALRVDKLTSARLDGLYRALRASGGIDGKPLAPATVRQCHAIIRRALNQAQRWGWVERNVATLAEPPTVPRVESRTLSRGDIAALLAHARTPEMALLVRLAVGTGARRGELCGLRWSDLDLDSGHAVIARSIYLIDNLTGMKAPKSGKARRVAIGANLVRELRAHHKDQLERSLRAGAPFADGYVLSETLDASTPLSPNIASDRFRALAKTCGLAFSLHDLRHAAATLALGAGLAPTDIASQLGHSSPGMTLDVYSHSTPAGLRAVADALDVG